MNFLYNLTIVLIIWSCSPSDQNFPRQGHVAVLTEAAAHDCDPDNDIPGESCVDTDLVLSAEQVHHWDHMLGINGIIGLADLQFSTQGDSRFDYDTSFEIVVVRLPHACGVAFLPEECPEIVTEAGVGAIHPITGKPQFCCDQALYDERKCTRAQFASLVINDKAFKGDVWRLEIQPKGEYTLALPHIDSTSTADKAGTYVVLMTNCDPEGRQIHVSGGIHFVNQKQLNKGGGTQQKPAQNVYIPIDQKGKPSSESTSTADTSSAPATDINPPVPDRSAANHTHHASIKETMHTITDKVSTLAEEEKDGILPIVLVSAVGLIVLLSVVRIVRRRRRQISGYDQIEMDELVSYDGESSYKDNLDTEFLDPTADLPDGSVSRRPVTSFSSRL